MISLVLCLFAILLLVAIRSGKRFLRRKILGPLRMTASPASESIAPAVYKTDLYGTLGIPRNSTREQIRDAYWAIVAKNHPDRNNSVSALEVFRNASYAYKILGKDKNMREKYDGEQLTNEFVTALGEVTSDIVIPLARDVAFPLLNFTVRGIGNFAKPIIRDVVEQSNAVYQATVEAAQATADTSSDQLMDNFGELFSRVAGAYEKTLNNQKIRKYSESKEILSKKIKSTISELRLEKEVLEDLERALRRYADSVDFNNRTANLQIRFLYQN